MNHTRSPVLIARCGLLLQSSLACLLVTFVSPAKSTEPIEMRFGVDSSGPKEPCIRSGQDRYEKGQFWGFVCPTEKHWKPCLCSSACCKMHTSVINNGTICDAAFHQNDHLSFLVSIFCQFSVIVSCSRWSWLPDSFL